MIDNDKIKSRRIRDLLYLEQCIVNVIHQEIESTLRDKPDDIIDRIKYICDESMLCNSPVLRINTKVDIKEDS
ncbi:MAG: hypothetical protein BWY47_00106 [Bacteroidetes bacterium ADurb.Bin302]|nr:MAG: hypothetical protein BWY47_00106 [Bacteroidetes bacterium ADurb.Bin302]